MLRQIFLLSFIIILGACSPQKTDVFDHVFQAENAAPQTTTLIVKRLSDDKVWVSNVERSKGRYSPASTSKIPHTLIALEVNIAEPNTLFKWDGQPRTFKAWNQDQTLSEAYRRSAVWVYQNITQALGAEVMTSWLTQFDYGNHDIGTNNLTTYWLSGPLEISAVEQVEFLTKFVKQELPLSAKTYEQSRKIFKNETAGTHTLYAKTGWMYDEHAMDIGWFVGWVEVNHSEDIYVFALNMDMPEQGDHKTRKPIVMKALSLIGAWPQ